MKYMNKLTLGIVLAAGLFTACSVKDDVDIPGGLALDKEEIAIGLRVEQSRLPSLPHRTGWQIPLSLG